MTSSDKSLFYQGIYSIGMGVLLLIIPETIISLMKLEPLTIGWARGIGVLYLYIGVYERSFGKLSIKPMINISIYTRLGTFLAATLLVIFKQVPFAVFLLGLIDLFGAIWTIVALKSEDTQK